MGATADSTSAVAVGAVAVGEATTMSAGGIGDGGSRSVAVGHVRAHDEHGLHGGGTSERNNRQRVGLSGIFGPVTSWRDTASAQAQADLDDLLGVVMPFAEQSLSAHGEFFPYGAVLAADGEARLIAADPGLGERPDSNSVLATLYDGARHDAPGLRAAAFVADVRANGSDAVRVELEHAEGQAIVVVMPYSRSRFKKSVTFGQASGGLGEPRVWPRT